MSESTVHIENLLSLPRSISTIMHTISIKTLKTMLTSNIILLSLYPLNGNNVLNFDQTVTVLGFINVIHGLPTKHHHQENEYGCFLISKYIGNDYHKSTVSL